MSKTLKIIMVMLLIIMTVQIFMNFSVYAADPNILTGKITDPTNTTELKGKLDSVLGVIQVVGTLAAVATLMTLGIKYMMGSVEEKASYKKSMLPYVIGAIFVFSAVNIASVVYNMSQGI